MKALTLLLIALVWMARSDSASAQGTDMPRLLQLDRCTGKAGMGQHSTLTVQPLKHQGDKYVGTYEMIISPLGFFSETGSIEVHLPPDASRLLNEKKPLAFKGDAKNDSGKPRTVKGVATPAAPDHGTVHLEIKSERGKLRFDTTFRVP